MSQKVLVVEDDDGILDAISLILEDEGYTVETVPEAEEVYTKLQAFKPDIILLDVLMSGIDGRDICKKLKSEEETKNIPIIMVSAHPNAKDTVKDCGANDFLPKPFDAEDLVRIVAKYIAK